MLRYETLFLAVPEITADESRSLEQGVEAILKNHDAALDSFDRWGKIRLAYTVKNNDYGVYFLVRYSCADGKKAQLLTNELRTFVNIKCDDLVMRFLTTKLDVNKPLEYRRPESVEEHSSRDVDTFLKENKMEGLLPSLKKDGGKRKVEASAQTEHAAQEPVADAAEPTES